MSNTRMNLVLILLISFIFTSCGDDRPESQDIVDFKTLDSGQCDLDVRALDNLLDEELPQEINCLESQINLFLTAVTQSEEGRIRRSDLFRFIDKFFVSNASIMKKSLVLGYDLSHLLFSDRRDSLDGKNISLLFDAVRALNKEGAETFRILREAVEPEDYWVKRDRLKLVSDVFIDRLIAILDKREGNNSLTLTEILDGVAGASENGPRPIDVEKVSSYFFLKKLILGGESGSINKTEVKQALVLVKNIFIPVLDAINLEGNTVYSRLEKNELIGEVVSLVKGSLFSFQGAEEIVSTFDLLKLANSWLPAEEGQREIQLEKGSQAVGLLKQQFIGGNSDTFTSVDFQNILSLVNHFVDQFFYNEVVFNLYQESLKRNGPVGELPFPSLEILQKFSLENQRSFWDNFMRITREYRFFAGNGLAQNFSYDFERSVDGYNQTYLFDWLVENLFELFGRDEEGKGRVVQEAELQNALDQLKPLLIEVEIHPENEKRFVFETMSSSDLFQYHANGDGFIDKRELTQYLNVIVSGYKAGGEVTDRLADFCEMTPDTSGNPTFEIACFRENYYQVLLDDLGYREQFSALAEYLDSLSEEDKAIFARNMEAYGREFDDENRPITEVDLIRLSTSLGNLESTILRFDENRDHTFTRNELDKAYDERFIETIVRLGNLTEGTRSSGRYIFLFFIAEQREPSPIELILFQAFAEKNSIQATRKEISGVLAFIAKESAKEFLP